MSMRCFLPVCFTTFCAVLSASNLPADDLLPEDRSEIVYVAGSVLRSENSLCVIDLGTAHTVRPDHRLAVFRMSEGYYVPLGQLTVVSGEGTRSVCEGVRTQKGDLVLAVRELHQLKTGRRHREQVLGREVVREPRRRFWTSYGNVELAAALSQYERRYPGWERSRRTVAGRLDSENLEPGRTTRLDQLQQQLDLMRRYYRKDVRAVAAAGEHWDSVMRVLAGSTARAGHQLAENAVLEKAAEDDDDGVEIAAADIRTLTRDRVFHLEREQQNVVAFLVAVLLHEKPADIRPVLLAAYPQTQFPGLKDDEELIETIQLMLAELAAAAEPAL